MHTTTAGLTEKDVAPQLSERPCAPRRTLCEQLQQDIGLDSRTGQSVRTRPPRGTVQNTLSKKYPNKPRNVY